MKIEIWSDIACPFCYIGRRNLELAMEELPFSDELKIEWRSFQLDPGADVEQDGNTVDMLAAKYGMSREQAAANQAQVAGRAAEVGLRMNADGGIPTNTLDAHRLGHLAREHGLAEEMSERLFRAHFAESQHVGRHEVLRTLALEVGLPEAEVDRVLAGTEYSSEVVREQEEGQALGVQGVPFFVLDRKYGISGAQPPEVFQQALTQAWEEHQDSQ